MKQKSFLLIFIAVIGLAAYSFGQNYSTIPTDSIHGFISPGGLMDTVLDNFGNKYNLRDIKIDSVKSILGGTQKSTTLISCNSGYFNLYFESGSGMEGTDSVQSARRNVICQVFSDISAFINSPLTTTGNKVNIWIRDINQIFGIGVVNHYLGLSTPFYNVPYNYFNTKGGIADNEVWKTIHRGVDSYAGVMPPIFTQGNQNIYDGITFYHGMMAFNFNNISGVNVFNWNTNLSLQYSPSNYYDLYTVILHEAIHTLGIVSLISQFGTSKFNPQYNYYSRYDLQLKNHSLTQNLITNDSACSFYNYQFNPILDSLILQPGCPISGIYPNDTADCLNTLMYSGSVNMPVYTPTCFESSSSLSHFEDLCYPTGAPYGNNQYFVMSNAQDIGAIGTKRYLKPEERLVLCDIGYNTNSVFGDTTNHNYYNYNTATCFGINIAGINDVFFGVINNPIQITHILQNDTNAATFECLEDIFYSSPTSNLSATSGYDTSIINFTTSQAGIHLLRYIPVASSGQRGNITYIFVYLYSSDTNCLPTCSNLISNGNFETLTYPIDHDEPFIFNQVCGWYVERFTPQINPPNTSLNHTALIRADPKSFENPYLADGQNLYHESIGQFINIQPGNYKLNFDYKLGYLDSLLNKLRRFNIYLIDTNNNKFYIDTLYELDTTSNFIHYTKNFILNSIYKRIIFEPLQAKDRARMFFEIDNIVIKPPIFSSYGGINGNYIACDTIASYSVINPNPLLHYTWHVNSNWGNIISSNDTSVIVHWNSATSGIYTWLVLTGTDSLGCPGISDSLKVYLNTGINISISGSSIACHYLNNYSVVSNIPLMNFTWQIDTTLGHIISNNSGTITILWNTLTTGVYTSINVCATDTMNCHYDCDSMQIYINPNPNFNLTITGDSMMCNTSNNHYYVTGTVPLMNYTWYVDPNWGSITTNNGSSIVVHCNQPYFIDAYTWIKVCAYDTLLCKNVCDSMKVYDCCFKDQPVNNDSLFFNATINNPDTLTSRIIVRGSLTIHANVTISNTANVLMGPLAKIVVKAPYELKILNSTLKSQCQYMWDGIYVEPGAKLTIIDSRARDALNAVVSDGGGNFQLYNSTFDLNYKDVVVRNYNPVPGQPSPGNPPPAPYHHGTIKRCTFIGASSLGLAPHIGHYSYVGVQLNNVCSFTVGDASDTLYQNVFRNLFCGIFADNSFVKVYNNRFEQFNGLPVPTFFHVAPMAPQYQMAVYATRSAISNYYPIAFRTNINKAVEIGGDSLKRNYFKECRGGIDTYGIRADIYNNSFLNINENAIQCNGENGLSAYIRYNTIMNAKMGIVAQNVIKSRSRIEIDSNTISNTTEKGIWITNMQGTAIQTSIGYPHIWVRKNTINYYNQFYDAVGHPVFGIKAEKCDYAKICDNTIARCSSIYPQPTYNKDLWGIGVSDYTYGLVKRNVLVRTGSAIRTAGDCIKTDFFCNDIILCYSGFKFDIYSALSDQGCDTLNSQNDWMGNYDSLGTSGLRKITGDVATIVDTIKWYWYGTIDYNPEIGPGHPLYGKIKPIHTSTDNNNCSTIIYVRNPEDYNGMTRDELFKEIVNNEEMFGELQEQYSFYDRDMLYEQLKTDSGLIVMGTELDYKFLDFINAMESESGAYYRLYREALEAEEYELAQQYLNSLSDIRIVEYNIKTVNDIYLNYLENNYRLTEEEIETLTEIALQIPHIGGDAVYTARILLGLDPDQNKVPYFQLPTVKKLIIGINVFPNPAQDIIHFDFSNYIEEAPVSIEIFNALGQIVLKDNSTLQADIHLNIKHLQNGIYYYKVRLEKSNITNGKIMINK